jgi:S-formylglutathione hydrolase
MGGHGALTLGLKNPDKYASISAFAPISNPSQVPWGQKAFKGYLGDDKSQWAEYDATFLAKGYKGPEREILVDQGSGDNFLKEHLDPTAFKAAAEGNPKIKLNHRMQARAPAVYIIALLFSGERHSDFLVLSCWG